MNNKKTKQKNRIITYLLQIAVFTVTILALAFTGILIPLRPEYSDSEKRELAKFPEFSFESLFDGSYFSGIGTWYSDTYPGRESLIGMNTSIKELYGFNKEVQIHGELTGSDDIPDAFEPSKDSVEEATTWAPPPVIEEGLDTQSLGAVFVAGNVGYEYYNFNQSCADRYIGVINHIANELSGTANVYNMIVPTSIGITLPDNYMSTINSSDQNKAINYMCSGMNNNVKQVKIYNTMMDHRKEYIYFNTDHHWTALGAYYAYSDFCKVKGIPIKPVSEYTTVEYDGFLGSFYNDTGKLPALEQNPDTIIAYLPNPNAQMVYTTSSGKSYQWKIINDVSTYNASYKYSAFIGGDNPFTEITNPDITDGSTALVVKESFGNAFVPFLVDHYSKVYVIDYRYYKSSILDFVKSNNVEDVIYVNNISATRNSSLISKIEQSV